MESKRTATTYFIPPGKFLLMENALGNPDLIQSSVSSDCRVAIVDSANFPLDELEQWPTFRLTSADIKLKLGDGAYYIYIVVPTPDNTESTSAFISYNTALVDRDGYQVIETEDEEGNPKLEKGPLLGKSGFKYYQCGVISARGGNASAITVPAGQGRLLSVDLGVNPQDANLDKKVDWDFFYSLFKPHYDDPKDPTKLTWIEAKSHMGIQGGVTMFIEGEGMDLPSIYDGLLIDNDTIYWEEIKDEEGNVISKRLKARGGSGEGGITPTLLGDLTNVGSWANAVATEDRIMVQRKDSASWTPLNLSEIGGGSADFSNVLYSGEGNAFTSFVLSDDKKTLTFIKGLTFAEKSNTLSGYGITDAYTKTEVDGLVGKCLSLQGGTIQGDVRLRKGSEYTSPYLYFGDSDEVFLVEETDQSLTIHADKNILLDVGGNVTLNGDAVSTKKWVETQLGGYAEKSTTLAGYGIADAKIANGVITLGGNTITPLTSHQTIYNLTLQSGAFSATTFDPNGGAKTVNIPTTTSHISEGSNLYFTNARAVAALADTLKAYVTLSGTQTITGEKDFTGGLKVNGSPIVYDKTNKYWKLEGDLLVTGGITMYGVDGSSFGTIWDNAPLATNSEDYKGVASFDPNYFSVSNGYVTFIGQTEGGVADSIAWGNVTGKPSWITTAKPEYQYTEIKGTPDLAGYVTLSGNQTITGEKTFESSIKITRGFSILDDQGWGIVGVNPTGWTGLPTDGSAIGFGTGAAPVYIRTSGDDLYHYNKTKNASYKILTVLGGTMIGSIASQDIYPKTSNTYSLGTSSYLWSNFYTKKATVDGIEIKKSASGVLFIDGSLVVSGGITMYGTDGTTAPSIWNGAPKATTTDNTNGKGIASFDSKFFSVSNGHVTFIGDVGGLDESALAGYLSTNKYLTQTTGDARYLAIGGNAASAGMVKGNIVSDGNSATNTNKALAYYSEIPSTASNIPTSSGYQNAILSLGLHSNGATAQLFFSASQSLYYRPNVSTNWNEIAYTTSNVSSATTASKLSTVSKTAWGQTYWTSGGVPTSISGDMTGVGSITMSGVLQMSNGKAIKLANTSGVYKGIMSIDNGNNFVLGYDSSASSYDTYIDGFNMHFRTGNTHSEIFTLGSAAGAKFYLKTAALIIKRNHSSGGAYTQYQPCNQENQSWSAGVNNSYQYSWWYQNVSSGIDAQKMYLDSSGKLVVLDSVEAGGMFNIKSTGTYHRMRLFTENSNNYATGGATFLQAGNYAGTSTKGNLFLSGINVSDLTLCKIYGPLLVTSGITMYSDERKKTILNHVELSLKEVADAPLIEHYYNSDEAKTTHVGSVAQYWAGLNDWFCKEDGEGFLTMEIQNAALASAISVARELTRYESKTDKQIKKLKKRIGELEEEIETLKNK